MPALDCITFASVLKGGPGSGRYPKGSGEENPADTLTTMRKGLRSVDKNAIGAPFLLPDGSRLSHDANTHANALTEIGVMLDDALKAGVIRVTWEGIDVIQGKMTAIQARIIVDDFIFLKKPCYVDVSDPINADVIRSKQWDLHEGEISPSTLRAWVNKVEVKKGGPGSGRYPKGSGGEDRQAVVAAAIRRGEAHTVSEDEFVAYHKTGHIESDAYKEYEAGDFSYTDKKDFPTLLDTRVINGETVEIRLQTEPLKYPKYTVEASEAERNRLYEEYEAAAKAMGTSPMMAGIDLGWGSEAYNKLKAYDARYIASGSELIRDAHGEITYYSPEEMQKEGLAPFGYTVGAFVGDKAIGYAGDEFGATGIYLSKTYQRHGLGLTLLKTYLDKSQRLAKGRQFGQMTSAGEGLVRGLHRQLVADAKGQKWEESQHPRNADGEFAASGILSLADAPDFVATPVTQETDLTPAELTAMNDYTSHSQYIPMNALLRTGQPSALDRTPLRTQQRIDLLDAAIAHGTLDEATTFYRGLGKGGKVDTDFGFVSVTASKEIAALFANAHQGRVVQVQVPAGTHILHVAAQPGDRDPSDPRSFEMEFILPRGCAFETVIDDATTVVMRVRETHTQRPSTVVKADVSGSSNRFGWTTTDLQQMKGSTFTAILKFDEALHPRDKDGQFATVGVPSDTPALEGKQFTSEEGYQWHEQGPGVAWARALPLKDHRELGNYSGFGYHLINDQLRGLYTPPIIDEFVRAATPEEIARVGYDPVTRKSFPVVKLPNGSYDYVGRPPTDPRDELTPERLAQFGHPMGKRHAYDYKPDDPYQQVDDGRIMIDAGYTAVEGGPKMMFSIQRPVPDLKALADLKRRAAMLDDLIANRGLVLDEAITVERGAYLPGVSFEDLQAMAYEGPNGELPAVFEEKGFTSTMLGEAERRAKSYPALGKSESLYNRFGDKSSQHEHEVGSAIRFHITLPAGTKVADIEASRRLEFEHPRIPNPEPMDARQAADPFWIKNPHLWTKTLYDEVSKVKEDNLSDKGTRSESELLLGSGARFRVVKVQHGDIYQGLTYPTQVEEVWLEYIGGGSSDGRVAKKYDLILKGGYNSGRYRRGSGGQHESSTTVTPVAAQVALLGSKYPAIYAHYAEDTGTEMGSIGKHTGEVGEQWATQLSAAELAGISERFGSDVGKLMATAIALHDIGKWDAIKEGDKRNQHAHTIPILQQTLRAEGYSDKDITLATELINHDLLGPMMTGRRDHKDVAKALTEKAKTVGMDVADFATLQLAFYHADASAYPYITSFMDQDMAGKWTMQAKNKMAAVLALTKKQDYCLILKGGPGSGRYPKGSGDTESFEEWFGHSKVVNEHGEPLVVYKAMYPYDWQLEQGSKTGESTHVGAPVDTIERNSPFPSFDPADPEGVKIAGFFGDVKTANDFSTVGKGQAIYPVVLSIQNPFVIDAKGKPAGSVQFGSGGKAFRDAVRSGDYDGVIIKNTQDEGTLYVPLKAEQIKTAIGDVKGRTYERGSKKLRDVQKFDDAAHPHAPGGAAGGIGGQFVTTGGTGVVASDPALAVQAIAGIAAVEKLIPEAIDTADYTGAMSEAQSWDDVDQHTQDAVYEHFQNNAYEDADIDTSGLDQETRENLVKDNQEVLDDTVDHTLEVLKDKFPDTEPVLPAGGWVQPHTPRFEALGIEDTQALFEKGFQLKSRELDPDTLDYGDGEDEDGVVTLDLDKLRFTDGETLTAAEKKIVVDAWDAGYERFFEKRLQDAFESDSYSEARNELESQAVDEAWSNLGDTAKMGLIVDYHLDTGTRRDVTQGEPTNWVTGVEEVDTQTQGYAEDYARTHAIAVRLAEMRTDEIRKERGLLEPKPYEILRVAPQHDEDLDAIGIAELQAVQPFSVFNQEGQRMTVSVFQTEKEAHAFAAKMPKLQHMASDALIGTLWNQWKVSSSRGTSLSLQLAASLELGGHHRLSDEEVEQALKEAKDLGGMPTIQAYVRAQWEVTQTILQKSGEADVEVYRALMLDDAKVGKTTHEFVDAQGQTLTASDIRVVPNTTNPDKPDTVQFTFNHEHYAVEKIKIRDATVTGMDDGSLSKYETDQQAITRRLQKNAQSGQIAARLPELTLKRAGAQSTTGTLSVANSWQGIGNNMPANPVRVVIRVIAPPTSVISLPVFGQNEQNEHETVLVGTRDQWAWDAWRNHAPTFEDKVVHHMAMKADSTRLVVDLQAVDRNSPHWMSETDFVAARGKARRALVKKGGPGSGRYEKGSGQEGTIARVKATTWYHASTATDLTAFSNTKVKGTDYDAPYTGVWLSTDEHTSPAMINPTALYEVEPIKIRKTLTRREATDFARALMKEPDFHAKVRAMGAKGGGDYVRMKLLQAGYDVVIHAQKPTIDAEELERTGSTTFTFNGRKAELRKERLFPGNPDNLTMSYDLYKGGEYITGYESAQDLIDSEEEVLVILDARNAKIKRSLPSPWVSKFDEALHPRNPDGEFSFAKMLSGPSIAGFPRPVETSPGVDETIPQQSEVSILGRAIQVFADEVAQERVKDDHSRHPLGDDKIRESDTRRYMKEEIRDDLGDDMGLVIGAARRAEGVITEESPDVLHRDVTIGQELVQKKLDQWANTSGDHNPDAVRMQRAVQNEFNLDEAQTAHLGNAASFSDKAKAQDRAFVRAEYNRTQAWFKKRGITHVTVFRGMALNMDEGRTLIDMQPASSWTTDIDTAYDFASGHSEPRILVARVPVAQVLSTCVTGRGCLHEREIILLGKETKVEIFKATHMNTVKRRVQESLR